MLKKRVGAGTQRLEPINNGSSKRAEIFGNMKNHDKVMINATGREGLTYPDIWVNNIFDSNNNKSVLDEPVKRTG